jgi:hypothetical protein
MAETGERCRAVAGWRIAAAAGLAIAFAAPTARAADRWEGSGEVRLGLMHFDYAEREAGVFLDGEKGWVPSLTGELELHRDQLFGRLMLRLASGTVDYDGHTQSGLPAKTQTDEQFLHGELQFGGWVDAAKRFAIFGGLGWRRWTRDIQDALTPQPVSGFTEVYRWGELELGARWKFLERPRWSWDVDARIVRTYWAEIAIDLSKFGDQPSNPTSDLGSKTGWRVGSTFRHDLNPNGLFVVVSGWAEGYAFGKSDEVIVFDPALGLITVHEPDSKTTNLGLEVGVGGKF